jgi:hypothetical protein
MQKGLYQTAQISLKIQTVTMKQFNQFYADQIASDTNFCIRRIFFFQTLTSYPMGIDFFNIGNISSEIILMTFTALCKTAKNKFPELAFCGIDFF